MRRQMIEKNIQFSQFHCTPFRPKFGLGLCIVMCRETVLKMALSKIISGILFVYAFLIFTSSNAFSQTYMEDYFLEFYNGQKIKIHYFTENEINYETLSDQTDTSEIISYNWIDGVEDVNGTTCLRGYTSTVDFYASENNLTLGGSLNGLAVTFSTERFDSGGNSVAQRVYDPYLVEYKEGMGVGDTYSYSYAANETGNSPSQEEADLTITIIGYETVTTHYGTYEDCLKYTVTGERTTTAGGIAYTDDVDETYWAAFGLGPVRTVSSGYLESETMPELSYNYTTTLDILYEDQSTPPVDTGSDQTDSDGDGVVDSEDACPGYDDNVDSDNDGIPDGCDDSAQTSKQGFDYLSYLAFNADLPQTWTKAECMEHYRLFGFFEFRAVSFNLEEYLIANPDLPTSWTYEEALNHYNLFGKNENRLLAFDAQEYLSLYPDLPQDWTYEQAFAHYTYFGKQEGRIASFDETAYLELYPDLPLSWGQAEAFLHYLLYGISEGRIYDSYDEDVFDSY